MTLTEIVVSAVILGISSQVSLQGWSRTHQAAATSARIDQQVLLLEQRLLASRLDCRCCRCSSNNAPAVVAGSVPRVWVRAR